MKKLYLFLACSCLYLTAHSQQDTAFWFAPPEVSSALGDQPIGLRLISLTNPATVTITQPANGGFTPIVVNLGANATSFVNLSPFLAAIESPSANAANNNGLKITSNQPITATYELGHATSKEFYSLKGNRALGTNFYAPAQKFWNNGVTAPASFSSFEIIASEDNTTVLITPRAAITGHAANITYSVILNRGQTYSARETDLLATTSLAGSIISSNKPVAVTVFHGAMSNGCLSSVGDQITTTDFIGRNYVVRKNTATAERVYVMAIENGTTIDFTNLSSSSNTLINWGETFEYVLTDSLNYIACNKPVYVWHMSGDACKLSAAQLAPVFCAGTTTTSFSRPGTDPLSIILYTRNGFQNQFTLNGSAAPIPASAFAVVPGTSGEFVCAKINLPIGTVPANSFNIVENQGDVFGLAVLYGNSTVGTAYAFLSEFQSSPFVFAGADATICANVPFSLNGIVGGGSVTGQWGGSGFGTFQNGLNALVNTYIPSALDTVISPIQLILTSTGPCPVRRDTLILTVQAAPLVNASADQTVCGNNAAVNLNGSVGGGASTGIWSTSGSGTFIPNATTLNAVYMPSSADTAAGAVNLTLTATNIGSCAPENDVMMVTITDIPTATIIPDTVYVCSNNPVASLSGIIGGISSTGRWVSTGNGIFSPSNLALNCNYSPSVTDVSSGFVTIYLESTNNGTCLQAVDSVVIAFTPSPVVSAGTNLFSCTNSPQVQLNGSISGPTNTGIWSGGAGVYSPSNTALNAFYTPTASEISSGFILLTLTSTNNLNCNSVASTVRIDFVAPPFANFNFNNVCLNNTTSFQDFSLPGFGTLNSWNWTFGDAGTSLTQNPTHLYANHGVYPVQLIVSNTSGCFDTIVQNVTVHELPVADFSYTTTCSGSQVIVDFVDESTISNNSINYWFWDFGGFGQIVSEDATQIFTGVGTFNITHIVATANGCRDTLILPLVVQPRPQAAFNYNTNNGLNIGAEVEFIDSSSFATIYYWTFGDGSSPSTLSDPTHIYFANGTYLVTQVVYDNLGCSDTATLLITINTVTNTIDKLIPNAISPNGDGKNDVWKLPFINILYQDAIVDIFNRWGQLIYHSVGYSDPWDGNYNGEQLPPGNYYYVIDINDGKTEPFKGTILLMRN